ncbi:hypothetical protein MXB_729 [Myxobolus squamalis]|nr:hypothetical protein MXB_729 [Myxobolus squamalis]
MFKDIWLIDEHNCGEPIAGIGELLSAKNCPVNHIRIQSMDLRLTPNDIYFNIRKNATTLF